MYFLNLGVKWVNLHLLSFAPTRTLSRNPSVLAPRKEFRGVMVHDGYQEIGLTLPYADMITFSVP